MNAWSEAAVAALLSGLLAACGGGEGGDHGTGTHSTQPEGFWVGETDSGKQGAVVLLRDGELWGVMVDFYDPTVQPSGGRSIYRRAAISPPGAPLSGHLTYLSFDDRGMLRSETPFQGSIDDSGALRLSLPDTEFLGAIRSTYAVAATLQQLAGNYRGRIFESGPDGAGSRAGTMEIDREGSIRHVNGTCVVEGSIAELAPPRQVMSVQLHSTGCAETDDRSGIVVLDFAATPPRLYLSTVRSDLVGGLSFIGTR